MRKFLLTASLVLLTATRTSAVTLLVDDDLVQCPTAPYTTVQAAVAAASAGDTVKLCAGLYSGQVVVTVPLRITGKAPSVTTCNALPPLNPANYSIFDAPAVAGPGGIGIDVLANKVTIEKMVVRGAGEAGIRTDPATEKFRLRGTVITQNAKGLSLQSAVGSRGPGVENNCFAQNGSGIYVGYGIHYAKINKNLFFDNNVGAAIYMDQLSAVVSDHVKIVNSESTSDVTFAVLVGTDRVTVGPNKIIGAPTTGTAIFVGANNTALRLTQNTMINPGGSGIRFNTQLFPGFPPTLPTSTSLVLKNTITNAGSHGINVESVAGEATLVGSNLTKNTVTGAAGDGIRIEDPLGTGANYGNEVEGNTLSGSANHDCHDASIGVSPAGTANEWQANTATTQSVANLCFTGPPGGVAD